MYTLKLHAVTLTLYMVHFTKVRFYIKHCPLLYFAPNFSYPSGNRSQRCSYPGFCGKGRIDIYRNCFNKTLLDCEECGMAGGAVILLLAVSLGLAILTANALTMLVGIRRCRRGKANKLDICRSSLALADALTSNEQLSAVKPSQNTLKNFLYIYNETILNLSFLSLSIS